MNLAYLKKYGDLCDLEKLSIIQQEREKTLHTKNHQGLLDAVETLPNITAKQNIFDKDEIYLGDQSEINKDTLNIVKQSLKKLIPWKKGPFNLFGIELDAEWRSDFKWNRISPHLKNLEGAKILDIGCNNGYFMFKLLQYNPELVLGIDPVARCFYQFKMMQHFLKAPNLQFELFGIEHLKHFSGLFDLILNMGIIYHHRNPISQLQDTYFALKKGGKVILETLAIEGENSSALFPEGRYAKMRNVWFVPTENCLVNWVKKTHFKNIKIISNELLTENEQRLTKWCPAPFQSLTDFLDPTNPSLTIEGHPAPRRIALSAEK